MTNEEALESQEAAADNPRVDAAARAIAVGRHGMVFGKPGSMDIALAIAALAAADAVDPVRAEEAAKARHPLTVVDPGPAVLVTPVQTTIAMDDIVHRLRQEGADAFHKHYSLGMWKLCAEAADEIERLRAAAGPIRAPAKEPT